MPRSSGSSSTRAKCPTSELLKVFWEAHDPTQGMRQGNDIGSQYRSMLLHHVPEQQATAEKSRDAYQEQMTSAGYGEITTSILPLDEYYFAEDYHQQYLFKNPAATARSTPPASSTPTPDGPRRRGVAEAGNL